MRKPRALVLLLCLASCAWCEKRQGAAVDLLRYVPKDAEGVVLVPDLGVVGDRLRILSGLKIASFLAGTQGFGSADEVVQNLVSQVGIDFRSRDALAKAGLEPSRGLAVAILPGGQAYTVVAVKDADTWKKTVAALALSRLGAGSVTTKVEPGSTLISYARTPGGEPGLAVLLRDGVALVAPGAVASRLAAFGSLPLEASLAEDAAYKASRARLGGAPDFVLYAPASSPALRARGLPGVCLAGALSASSLTLRADAPWPNTRSSLQVLDKKPGPDLLGMLPPDAFLVARFQGEPSLLAPFWPLLVGPYVEQAARAAGFDVKAEVLDNLQPGEAVALAVAPTAKLSAGVPELDVRRTNPFQFVHLAALAKAKDAAKAEATLEKLPPVAQRFGAHVTPTERGGKKVFVTSYTQGEGTHFALVGDTLVLAAPLAELDASLKRLASPGAGPAADPGLRGVLSGSAAAAVLDLRQLAESVKALPSEAWGIGGFAIKATTVRWLDATDDLRAITLALSEKDGALQGELALRFGAK